MIQSMIVVRLRSLESKSASLPLEPPTPCMSSTVSLPKSIGFPFSFATLVRVERARSLFPEAAMNRGDSGSQEQLRTKQREGRAERARSHRQPSVGITSMARMTSRHAPSAQKQSNMTTHLPLCLVGRNSAYKVTDWGTQPMLNPTINLYNEKLC